MYINLPKFGLVQASLVTWVLTQMALARPSAEVPVTKENIDMAISKAQGLHW